ncbi:MAG: HNH endonuclease [Azoarcus sp.]|nr:HNH endonuclease [Azoarcus sp.]
MKILAVILLLLLPPPALADEGMCPRAGVVQRDKNGKILRSHDAKRAFKQLHPCPSTGKTKGSCPGYVIDHIVPLKRGGADMPCNMQWQTVREAKAKDKWE